MTLPNPKLGASTTKFGRSSWYPYYAGFSFDFATEALRAGNLSNDSVILDPWNGGGTTTWAARSLGFKSIGFDLNPVMVIAAKARAMGIGNKSSIIPIATDILAKATLRTTSTANDPLTTWFVPRSAAPFRSLERSIQQLLVNERECVDVSSPEVVARLSELAAFYYVALFRTVRYFLRPFIPTNPTWTKRPRDPRARLRPRETDIYARYRLEVERMLNDLEILQDESYNDVEVDFGVASSTRLPLSDESIDFVLSSPPYCTRIDYAVATMPELAILGLHPDYDVDQLRRELIGTPTVARGDIDIDERWGRTCITFLKSVAEHPSKASSTYYYKNHCQYFAGIFRSLTELKRVVKPNGHCVLVVQDSYYKDIHNDLPKIFQEMLYELGFVLNGRTDYTARTLMAHRHPGARKYRPHRRATESVLFFRKVVA